MSLVLKPGEGNKDSVVVDESNVDGLFNFSVFHIIKQSEAQFLYTGPKIPKDEWEKMLAFFRWTWETYHSESQARLYVNRAANTWKIWVYPQESKTGMAAREINDEEMQRQQGLLGPEWMSFGTVHHHCNCSAFQSGTDEENEKNQDGLHVTIGSMGSKQYDIHARFYRKGRKFLDFPMTWFWEVGDELDEVPEWLWGMLQGDAKRGMGDKIAKQQMTTPPGPDVAFPEEWKTNVKEIKTQNSVTIGGTPYFYGGTSNGNGGGKKKRGASTTRTFGFSNPNDPLWKRCNAAWDDILEHAFMDKFDAKDIEICLDILKDRKNIESIFAFAMYRHKLDPDDLHKHMVSKKDLEEHDLDLQAAGYIAGKQPQEPTVTLPVITSPQATHMQAKANQILGMSDEEWAEYQMQQERGGID